jgi:hypothetical protein
LGHTHFVKQQLRCRCYLRYTDDFAVFDDDLGRLHEVKAAMQEYLAGLRLYMHEDKCQTFPVRQGCRFLGFRIFPTHRRLVREGVTRFRRRVRQMQKDYAAHRIQLPVALQSMQSWNAHAAWGNTWRLREQIFADAAFCRSAYDLKPMA